MAKEAKARIKINKLLEQSGWRLLDDSKGKANVILEAGVKTADLGDDFEHVKRVFTDYLLVDENDFPIAVLEAKSEDKDPLTGKEQARKYATAHKVRFVILSNGNSHFFWDIETGNPTRISHFPALGSLKGQKKFTPDSSKLIQEEICSDYIARTQNPYYDQDPRWKNESDRKKFIDDTKIRFLRGYQVGAVQSLQKAVSEGQNRFLFEMATGTGKTLAAGAIIKLYLKTGNARRVLFLVDRLELETQAERNLNNYLKPDYTTVIFKEATENWRNAEIVITTIQSISYENKYLKIFSPTDFDLIISDEAHRSISGNSRVIFEYFIGSKLGLTATPKDYLKNLDEKELADTDPRQYERRVLLSTYKTFGCESGNPTFRYTLADGVKDERLVNPIAIDCRTDITTQLLSEEGYAVMVENEEGEEDEVIYWQTAFERNFFNEQTNEQFVKTFMDNAKKDPITNEIGKTIIFCVSRIHAGKITQLLNKYAQQMFPDKYNSDFALQITSDITDTQQFAMNFSNNNLSGHTRFLDGYKSSKTRVCVTVGMMTTGYDCEDILNICLMRPIFSPTDFVQIKGRGTRTYTFKFEKREGGQESSVEKKKDNFKLFDYFAICQYFETEFPYDEIIKLPKGKTGGDGSPPPPPPPIPDKTVIDIPDPIKTMEVLTFDGNIMRVDKELYANTFESKVKDTYAQDSAFKDVVDKSDYEEMERYVKENLFNKPEEYYTIEKLRQSYNIDRRLTLWEILDKIFGRIPKFKTKDELADEEFEKYTVYSNLPPEAYYEAREIFKLYLTDETARTKINQKEFGYFAYDPAMIDIFKKLGQQGLASIAEYVKDNISINRYM